MIQELLKLKDTTSLSEKKRWCRPAIRSPCASHYLNSKKPTANSQQPTAIYKFFKTKKIMKSKNPETTKSLTEERSLPRLTSTEKKSALRNERERNAKILHCSPENIHLSPEAIRKVLLKAQEDKQAAQQSTINAEKDQPEKVYPKPTTDHVFEYFMLNASEIIGRPFRVDNFNFDLIEKLCMYFAADPKAEEYGISLKKGIMLVGGPGVGKSSIMNIFLVNPHQSFRIVNCRNIAHKFSDSKFHTMQTYSQIEATPKNFFGQTDCGICLDDVGSEMDYLDYSEKVNPISEILLNRYHRIPFNRTHITTSFNAMQIDALYGPRIRSRMREMFNLIIFDKNAPDRRR